MCGASHQAAGSRIREGSWLGTDNMVEFNARPDGSLERRFWVGRTEHPFDPEGPQMARADASPVHPSDRDRRIRAASPES